jgi:NHLM bacteriocin system secretion protein
MSSELFRKTAMQTLSSPEQLDQLLKITRPRAWIALGAIGVVLGAALLWSIFGSLPTTVAGQGIIIRAGGTSNIVAVGNGVVSELRNFHVGDKIEKGQILGRIPQPAMELQIKTAQANLDRLRAEEKAVLAIVHAETPLQGNAARLEKEAQEKIIRAREDQLRSLRTVEQQQDELLGDGLITRQRYEETRRTIFAAQNDINTARILLQKLHMEELQTNDQQDERRRVVAARISEAQGRLNELQLQHQLAANIVSPQDGIAVEMMAMRGDTVKSGQSILSIEDGEKILEVMIFLPARSSAKLLRAGMLAQISPVDAKKERYGYLIGKISAVSKYPATEQGMMAVFNNAGLVRELSKAGPPVAVLVELLPDRGTKSGYQWSSNAGKAIELTSGTLSSGTFIVERKRPISLLIPLLRESIGL